MSEENCDPCRRLAERVSALEAEVKMRERMFVRDNEVLDRRFNEVNEFRSALSDLSKLMMTRTEFLSQHESLIQRMEGLNKRIDFNTTRLDHIEGGNAGLSKLTSWILAAIGLMISATVGWLAYLHTIPVK